MISKRVAAKYIKKAKIESLYGNPTELDNGSLKLFICYISHFFFYNSYIAIAWLTYDESRVKNIWGLKPLKGHKRDRTLVDR